ncbi:MAG: LLM class flavin-dependent oxidoreductase [Chloroflexi bacterium]|nr:LLM class flavin-dependent oxidoreductase [Chloroflexota bacterium]MBV9601593.1 LLM class flavin-dependent oxidoreductase [Chloroflexota bacterium]
MISRFSVLYVGHIALDNVGRDGTPADERLYPNQRLVEGMAMAEDVAHVMDDLGYETLWLAEHHFQREGYEVIPNLILMGTYLATQTRRLKFGCAFNVTPMWHPIRLAEDFAMADYLTRGRIVMGVGRGYHTREVETLGGPLLDAEANAAMFREQMEIMFKAFDEENWSHKGRFYTIPAPVKYRGYDLRDVTMVPRPVNRPVEVWQAIASGKSIPFMVQHRIKGMVTMNGELITRQIFGQFRDEAAKIGRNLLPGEDLAWGAGLYLADSLADGIAGVRPYHDERYKWFAPFGFVRYADEQGRPWGTPGAPSGVPTIEEGVRQKAWLVGTSSEVIQRLRDLEAEYPGLEHVVLHWPEGMPADEWITQLRMFARDVMPAFSARVPEKVGV